MFEWIVVSVLFLAVFVLGARKGHRHMLAPKLPHLLIGVGALSGWLLESLPLTPFRAGPSVQTLLAVVCGVLAGRMIARAFAGWGRSIENDAAKGHPPRPGVRLIHPLIAAGLWIALVPVLYALAASRHEMLEILGTPRDGTTGIVKGAEEVRRPATNHKYNGMVGVLLLHGFMGSPRDFGDLPDRLADAGYSIYAPLLPGHGRFPGDVENLTAKDYDDAVATACAYMDHTYTTYSVVGMSFGAALALRSKPTGPRGQPHAIVLVNPYLGKTATPSWLPFETDTLMDLGVKTFRRVIRPPVITRVNDPEGRKRQIGYWTVFLRGSVTARDMAREAAALPAPAAPVTVLLSDGDNTTPSAASQAWFDALPRDPSRKLVRFAKSDHVLLLDYDREAAVAAVVEAVSR